MSQQTYIQDQFDKVIATYPSNQGTLSRKYELTGGHSGAGVWIVNVVGKLKFHNGIAIAKIDKHEEIVRESRAHEDAQLTSIKPHVPALLFTSSEAVEGLGMVLYQ